MKFIMFRPAEKRALQTAWICAVMVWGVYLTGKVWANEYEINDWHEYDWHAPDWLEEMLDNWKERHNERFYYARK